jgi:ubiquinone/menaquinone biosynthesis C-methylase UbiE
MALGALLAHASDGLVAGVDTSELMVRQARSRPARAIQAGRLELRQADAGALPYADATFRVEGAADVEARLLADGPAFPPRT